MKKERLEQAMNGIDPAFLEESAAPIPAKVHRPLWKRAALTAACLAAVLAVSAAAVAVTEGWELSLKPDDTGAEIPVIGINYGGAKLPESTKQTIKNGVFAAQTADEDASEVKFVFNTLSEMEDFLDVDLPESPLYPISTEKEIYCLAMYLPDSDNYDIEGCYAFEKGDWSNSVNFHLNTWEGARLKTTYHDNETKFEYHMHTLEDLCVTASILIGKDGSHLPVVYFAKDNVAYEIRCGMDKVVPTDFLDSLY